MKSMELQGAAWGARAVPQVFGIIVKATVLNSEVARLAVVELEHVDPVVGRGGKKAGSIIEVPKMPAVVRVVESFEWPDLVSVLQFAGVGPLVWSKKPDEFGQTEFRRETFLFCGWQGWVEHVKMLT